MFLEGGKNHFICLITAPHISCITSLGDCSTSLDKKAEVVLAMVGDLPLVENVRGWMVVVL
jgi:hypothetical protein